MSRVNRRSVSAAAGAVVLVLSLAGCALQPTPVETRLPPGAVVTSAPPTAAAPSPTVVTLPPTTAPTVAPAPDPSTPATDLDALSCGDGGSQNVSGAEQTVRVVGTCAELTVSGSALTVDAAGATIRSLRVSGDRVRVSVSAIDALVVQGNDAAVSSGGAIGSVDLSGDRTTVDAGGAVSSVTVRGQDNIVRAGGGVGQTTIEGRGNQIG